MTGLVPGSGTVSVATGSTNVTFSTSQSGLTGLAFVWRRRCYRYLQQLDYWRQWYNVDIDFAFQWANEHCRHMEHIQSTLTLSATPQAGDAPFYGVMLQIDSEYMRCVG